MARWEARLSPGLGAPLRISHARYDDLKPEGLTVEDSEWLRINGKEKRMFPNEILITEGEALQEIYFVLSGLFSVSSEGSDGAKRANAQRGNDGGGEPSTPFGGSTK